MKCGLNYPPLIFPKIPFAYHQAVAEQYTDPLSLTRKFLVWASGP